MDQATIKIKVMIPMADPSFALKTLSDLSDLTDRYEMLSKKYDQVLRNSSELIEKNNELSAKLENMLKMNKSKSV